MKFGSLRTAVIAAVFAVIAVGIIAGVSVGTTCGIGWGDLALLCPLGALLSMISARTLIPRALISLAVAAAAVFLLGRAFCGWACPVSLWRKVQAFFRPKKQAQAQEQERTEQARSIGEFEIAKAKGAACGSCASCGACAHGHKALDSRHAVLGGALLATAVFGFPVFCLVCPIGLSFATVLLLVTLFGAGDLNLSLAIVPLLLVLELVLLRKWCTLFCPVSALINLVGRFSRTAVPQIDDAACLETAKGVPCGKCAAVCSYDVNLRHPEYGELPATDCARCLECVDACPAKAIRVVAVGKRSGSFKVELAGNDI